MSIQVRVLRLLVSLLIVAAPAGGQSVLISEFMADNGGSLLDEDGDSSDWIELHNTTGNPIDLSGWHLTDKPTNLNKWTFPITTIPAKGYLVIFASNKDRAISGSELHTDFKLSASGEYIGLVHPDGETIEDEVTFSIQTEDVSQGYAFSSGSLDTLLDTGAACTARVPLNAGDSLGWRETVFDDSLGAGWLSGITGVGYEAGTSGEDYTPLVGLDVETTMRFNNQSIYVRVPFTVADASAVSSLMLSLKFEDGFVAYINGTEVASSSNAPASPVWNSGVPNARNDADAIQFEPFDLSDQLSSPGPLLVDGGNILAIHLMNYLANSSDLLLVPKIEVGVGGSIDTGSPGVLATSTPGATNSELGFLGNVETPVVSPARGLYDSSLAVSASNVTPGATIRYTTDGSEPSESSPVFPASLTVSQTTNLRVRSFLAGWRPSFSRTDTYLFVSDVVTESQSTSTINGQLIETGLDAGVLAATYLDAQGQVVTVEDALLAIPSLSITTDDDHLFDPATGIYVNATEKWERPASAEWIEPDGSEGFQINAGLRIRGGYSRNPQFAKHSLRLFFRDEYGDGRLNYDFFDDGGITSFKKMDLRTTQAGSWAADDDEYNTLLRDIVFRDASAAMGATATRSSWCHVYLNGSYWGIYQTEERPDDNFGADYFGGDPDDYDLVKIWRPYDNLPWGDGFWIEDPAPSGTLAAFQRLHAAALAGFSSNTDYFAVQGMNASGQRDPAHERLLDVDNLIDYLLLIYHAAAIDNGITWWTGNNNLLNNLYGLYNRNDPDGFKWIQHDGEISYDRTARNSPGSLDRTGPFNAANQQRLLTDWKYFNPQTLHEQLLDNEEYRLKFVDRVYKHLQNNGALVRANSEARFDVRKDQIDRAVVAHSARWGSTLLDRDTWASAVVEHRGFFARSGDRCDEVIGYLNADGLIPIVTPPQLSQGDGSVSIGTTVSLTAATGTIYYTTDGSDPRGIGGVTTGMSYSSPLVINEPTLVRARARLRGVWSALTEGTFWTPEIPLAVTELMYHAPGGDVHDYIEIRNLSSSTVLLEGYELSKAVRFALDDGGQSSLAAGQFMVVVDDIDAFNATYPTAGVTVAGEYRGDFSNGGERLKLLFHGIELVDFSYSDARNWPQAADGAGHSLVPKTGPMNNQESGALDYGGNWRASTYLQGSPGFPDPTAASTVVLNEVIAHTDTGMAPPLDSNDVIELYNPTGWDVDLTGWSLSDDLDNPAKWTIPNGTIISARGFLTFDEDDFHPDRISGFGLGKSGEEVVLSAPGRVVDAVRFKGQENGVSLGRYPDGGGDWLMTMPSPGFSNSPVVSNVRIGELMFQPPTPNGYPSGDVLEYILLENIGSGTELLETTAGSYRIDGGVSYSFSPGSELDAGDRIFLVSFDPADTVLLNLFTSTYGLNPLDETILGPYYGRLSNTGERVALERPQDSDDLARPEDISWVVLDELYYFTQNPWPTGAQGTGYPLLRTGLSRWGVPSATDTDADLMPDAWEMDHFGELVNGDGDWDGDRRTNFSEFIADTDPDDVASFFVVDSFEKPTLQWTARPGRVYSVSWTDDLRTPFEVIASGLTSGSFTDTVHAAGTSNFYRLKVELE